MSSHFLQNVRPRTQSSMTPPARTKDKDSSEGSSRARTQSHSQPLHKGKKSKGHGSTKSTRSPQLEHQKSPPLSQHFMEDSLDLVDSESTRLEKFGKLLAGPSTDIGQLKKLSWSGIPPAVRATTWQILLVRAAAVCSTLILLTCAVLHMWCSSVVTPHHPSPSPSPLTLPITCRASFSGGQGTCPPGQNPAPP